MSEFLVTNAVPLDGDPVDVEIHDGRIERVVPAGEADPDAVPENRHHDAGGRLVTPPPVEVHTHLYAALTGGLVRWNESNTLAESLAIWEAITDDWDAEGIKERARTAVEWFAAHGITRIRSHVGVDNPPAVEAMLELREAVSDLVEIQLVAFPHAFVTDETTHRQLERALELGVDVVGGMPHGEHTRELGVEHVGTIMDLAERYDRPVDVHVDQTDDPGSRFTEVVAAEALQRGIGDRVTASHATAMHSYPNAYADDLCRLLAESGVSVVTNPMTNAVLQGSHDDYPRRRGHARIDELRERGVTVGVGHDGVIDTSHAYGDGDPLKTLFLLLHYAHMAGRTDVPTLWEMLIEANAEIYGVDESYGLREGAEGSLVVYDAPGPHDAVRTVAPRTLVLRDGDPLARTERRTYLETDDGRREVTFDYAGG